VGPLREDELPDVVALYNTAITDVPLSYPVDADTFSRLGLRNEAGTRYRTHLGVDRTGWLVARRGGQVVGFLHVCIGADYDDRARDEAFQRGIIRFLVFLPSEVEAGTALLAAADSYFRQQQVDEIRAFHFSTGYPFYHAGIGLCPGQHDHVMRALATAGYRLTDRFFCFTRWLSGLVPEQTPRIPIRLEFKKQAGDIHLRVYDGYKPFGILKLAPLEAYSDYVGHLVAYIASLRLDEPYRHKGIGRWLMQRALNWLWTKGYREVALHVNHANVPAQSLYRQVGFAELAFRGYTFERHWEEGSGTRT